MTASETNYSARLQALSEMPGMPEDWRNTMRGVLAEQDAGVRAVRDLHRALKVEDDKGLLWLGTLAQHALRDLMDCYAGRIAELNARDAKPSESR